MSRLVEVGEHESVSVDTDIVEATPTEFWLTAGCEVTRTAGASEWRLRASSNVGVSRIQTAVGDVTLHVIPKLLGADVFFLADYAYGQRHEPLRLLDGDNALLEILSRDPAACLLVWHARAIDQFAARWLRRGYQSNVRVLNGKVRGKILVSQYVNRHLAVADAANVPCRVLERTQDTPNNRLLKAGLRHIAAASQLLPVPQARRAVLRQVGMSLPRFAQVSDIAVSVADIRATSSRGPHRHYGPILASTKALLDNQYLGDSVGSHASRSFTWQMPVLFQEAVRGFLSSASELSLIDERAPSARVLDHLGKSRTSAKVDPDFVLSTSAGSLLLDTKYKDALPVKAAGSSDLNSPDFIELRRGQRIKIGRPDIYQMLAYRQHERWPGSTTALLYPVVLEREELLPHPMTVNGFGLPVHIWFVDIGPFAQLNLGSFIQGIRDFTVAAAPVREDNLA